MDDIYGEYKIIYYILINSHTVANGDVMFDKSE